MYFGDNHVSYNVRFGRPWECGTLVIPDEVRGLGGKKLRDAWLSNKGTRHHLFTVFEGVNNAQRVTTGGGNEDIGNLPLAMHGVVADLDFAFSTEELPIELEKLTCLPNWIERTLSGNWLLLWRFSERLALPPTYNEARAVAQAICKKLRVDKLQGFDAGSFEPSRRFTNSGEWWPVSKDDGTPADVLPNDLVRGWATETLRRLDCGTKEDEDIPIAEVYLELEKKFPGVKEWPDEFILDSTGPSFWIPGSTSPKSAIVKSSGLFTFATHANGVQWWPWKALLGAEFVEKHTTGKRGRILNTTYFDGRNYFVRDMHDVWRATDRIDIILKLKNLNVVAIPKKGELLSEMDRLLYSIQHENRLEGAGPYVFRPPGLIQIGEHRKLNTFSRKLCIMHPRPVKWGEGFDELIAPFTEHLFAEYQIRYLLSWLNWAWKGYSIYRPETGQALILAGKPGMGKSCWTNEVIGELFGGAVDASAYMTGEDTFGGELYNTAIWTLEDTALSTNPEAREKMTRRMKQFVANIHHREHSKYKIPNYTDWAGRLVMGINDDAQSMQAAPQLDTSIMDKLLVLHVRQGVEFDFPSRHAMTEIFAKELPYFARFVNDWEIPEELKGNARFGVKPFIDESVERLIINSSTTAGLAEVINEFATEYFLANPKETEWIGTVVKLCRQLGQDESLSRVMKIDVRTMSRGLPQLSPHLPILNLHSEADGKLESRLWRITPPAGLVHKPKKPKIATAA
jgi:hypothetical protein